MNNIMELRFIEREGKKVLQFRYTQNSVYMSNTTDYLFLHPVGQWQDVPFFKDEIRENLSLKEALELIRLKKFNRYKRSIWHNWYQLGEHISFMHEEITANDWMVSL